MHILLSVLKIIGIILLVLLAVLLVVLLLVLFVPVCYRAEGSYKEGKPYAKAQLRFLFPVLYAFLSYKEGKPEGKIKVLGICVRDFFDKGAENEKKAPKEKNAQETKNAPKTKNAQKAKKSKNVDGPEKIDKIDNPDKTENLQNTDNTVRNAQSNNQRAVRSQKQLADSCGALEQNGVHQTEEKKKSFPDKLKYYISYLKEKIRSFVEKVKEWRQKGLDFQEKIKNVTAKIKRYKEIWEMDVTQRAYAKAKKSLSRLFESIKPGKGNLRIHFGTDDPAKTGEICAYFGMIYPFVGNYVMIEPDFEQKIAEGDFFVKGRITVFALLRAAWIFLFDKDIKVLKEILTNPDSEEDKDE